MPLVSEPVFSAFQQQFGRPTQHDRLSWLTHVLDGVRDIFMGIAIYSAALFGTKKSLAWTLIAASGVAFADGAVCFSFGNGHWNHWGYAPIITAVGSLLLGVWDSDRT